MRLEDLLFISPYVRTARNEIVQLKYSQYIDFDYAFTYIIDGILEYKTDGADYKLTSGNGLLMPPFCPHFAFTAKPVAMCVIHFDFFTDPNRISLNGIGVQEYIQSISPDILHPQKEQIINKPFFYTFESIDRMYVRNKVEKITALHKASSNFLKLKSEMIQLIDILQRSESNREDIVKRNLSSWPTVMRTVDYIEKNYQNPELSNEIIYNEIGACKSYLSTIFKSSTGLTIHHYLLNVRISRAKELLLKGYSATEVSSMVGFVSLHSFIRAFKQITGYTPTEFASSGFEI